MNQEHIFDTTIALFRRQGIRATRMDDVAECLQIPKRTLYEQYPSKEEFILTCIKYEIEKEQEIVRQIGCRANSPLKYLVKLYSHAIRFLSSFHPSFFKELKRFPKCSLEMDRYIKMLRAKFNDILLGCIRLGLCVKDCDTFLFSAFLSFRLEDIKEGAVSHPREKVPGISRFVVHSMLLGYATERGRNMLITEI